MENGTELAEVSKSNDMGSLDGDRDGQYKRLGLKAELTPEDGKV